MSPASESRTSSQSQPGHHAGRASSHRLPAGGHFWLNEHAFTPFIDEVRAERVSEVERIADHVELSLTEVLLRNRPRDWPAPPRMWLIKSLAQRAAGPAEARHDEAMARRERRRRELTQQRALTLQGVDRLTSVLVLPHPESEAEDVRRLRPNVESEMTCHEDGHGV